MTEPGAQGPAQMKELDGFLERDRDRGLFDLPPPNKEISDGNSGWKAAESRELPQDRQWRAVRPLVYGKGRRV